LIGFWADGFPTVFRVGLELAGILIKRIAIDTGSGETACLRMAALS
jgi:hypothetical protein